MSILMMFPETQEELEELITAIRNDPQQYKARYLKFCTVDSDLVDKFKHYSETELTEALIEIVKRRYKIASQQHRGS